MAPLISVVMSVYNGEAYLDLAIDSILAQSYENFEFIIVNDGSNDGSLNIINSYAKKDKRIFVLDQNNCGLTKSLNNALFLTKGKYVARQDADDISSFDRFEKQVEFLEREKDFALVGCLRYDMDENGKTILAYKQPTTDSEIRKTLFGSNPFVHGSLMIRQKVISEVGFYNDKLKYAQDYDIILKIAENHKVHILPYYLYNLRIITSSITRTKFIEQDRYKKLIIKMSELRRNSQEEDLQKLYVDIVEKKIGYFENYYLFRMKNAKWNRDYGKQYFFRYDYSKARNYFIKSLKTQPTIETFVFYLLSYFPEVYWKYIARFRKIRKYISLN